MPFADKARRYERESKRRARQIELGLCTEGSCPKPPVPGKRLCVAHAEQARQRSAKDWRERRGVGMSYQQYMQRRHGWVNRYCSVEELIGDLHHEAREDAFAEAARRLQSRASVEFAPSARMLAIPVEILAQGAGQCP